MSILLSALRQLPEYGKILTASKENAAVALSGAGQIARSHLIAALSVDSQRPLVVVCQDDTAAKRMQEELFSFLGTTAPILPSRDMTFHHVSVVSRGWEQKRLRQLYDLARGECRLQIVTLDALCMRSMPKETLYHASASLKVGATYEMDALIRALEAAGYSRCTLVEGVGQFALRGGILDVFSPAYDHPIRGEFFGDELDAMGFFNAITQRRTENLDSAILLPVAETQPHLHPEGIAGLCGDLHKLLAKQNRRKNKNQPLIDTLTHDVQLLEQGVSFPAADRYMALIYPQNTCGQDYISKDALVIFCDHGNLQRVAKQRQEMQGMELDNLLQGGMLVGELCDFTVEYEDLFDHLTHQPLLYLDNFLSAAYPKKCPPKALYCITAKQLPAYGTHLDTAVQDLQYYQKNNFATLVLCGNRRRGEILQGMLSDAGLSAFLAFPATSLPQEGQILLCDGSLANGMEYPTLRLAIMTEGQISAAPVRKKVGISKKKATNRQKLSSFSDLSVGDLVVHEYHGIGKYVGMEQMKVDGAIKDYVKIAYQGTDALFVPATQLDLVSKYIGGGENATIRLHKLGGEQWQKAKAKAKTAAKDLAAGLIKLYAQRKRVMGYSFSGDSPWQVEFEESFEYVETDDQLRCIAHGSSPVR